MSPETRMAGGGLRREAGEVLDLLEPYLTLPAAAEASRGLARALEVEEDRRSPVSVALVGGTGVGKSELFNALIGRPGASPVSGVVRPCTAGPVLARDPGDAGITPPPGAAWEREIDWPHPGLALVDTPDLDSREEGNRDTARRVLDTARVVVYVTDPEKISNLEVIRELYPHAKEKRWLFVLNKLDSLPDETAREESRNLFLTRLKEMGFPAGEEAVFALSALDPRDPRLAALRDALLAWDRRGGLAVILAEDAFLGRLAAACGGEEPPALESVSRRLAGRRDELLGDLRQSLEKVLQDKELHPALAPMIRRHVFARLPGQARGPLALPLMLQSRAAGIGSAWQVWRALGRGLSFTRVFKLGASLWSVYRGVYDLQELSGRLAVKLEGDMDGLERRARQVLEDSSVYLSRTGEAAAQDPWGEVLEEMRGLPVVGRPMAGMAQKARNLRRREGRHQEVIQDLLSRALAGAGEELARGVVRWYDELLALLPLPLLGQAMWILGKSWWEGTYLGVEFYLHALALFILLWLPSYLLVVLKATARVRRGTVRQQVARTIELTPPLGPLEPLDRTAADLLRASEALTDLERRALAQRAARSAETGLDRYETAG